LIPGNSGLPVLLRVDGALRDAQLRGNNRLDG
jgi:hypothetical protein